jgi:hypothetical protein
MAQAKTDNNTTRRGVSALHGQLRNAGMQLMRQSGTADLYCILWHRTCVIRDLTLVEAAKFVDRALRR